MTSKEVQEAEATLESLGGGFAKVYNWVFERVKADHLNHGDLGVYVELLRHCDWSTGIYHGTAAGIAAQCFDNPKLAQPIQRSMRKLRDSKLINYPEGKGSYYNYDVLIHGFESTSGKQKGWVLNAWRHGSSAVPFYHPQPEGDVEGDLERNVETDVAGDVASNVAGDLARVGKRLQMNQTLPDIPDMADVPNVSDQSQSISQGLAEIGIGNRTRSSSSQPSFWERIADLMLYKFFEYTEDQVSDAFYQRTLDDAHLLIGSKQDYNLCRSLLKHAKGKPSWLKSFKEADTPMAFFASDKVFNRLKQDMEQAPPVSKAEVVVKSKTPTNVYDFSKSTAKKG